MHAISAGRQSHLGPTLYRYLNLLRSRSMILINCYLDSIGITHHQEIDAPRHYDKDYLVREVTAFYEFLTTIYIPSNTLRRPPSGKWPNINIASYNWLN